VALKTFQQPVLHRQVVALTLAIKESGFFKNVEQVTKAKTRSLLAILKESSIVMKYSQLGEAVQLYLDESVTDFAILRDRHDSFLMTFIAEQYLTVPEKLQNEIVWQVEGQVRQTRVQAIESALKTLQSIGNDILMKQPMIGMDGLDEQSSRNVYENEYYHDDYPTANTAISPKAPSVTAYDSLYYSNNNSSAAPYPTESLYAPLDTTSSNYVDYGDYSISSMKRSPLAAASKVASNPVNATTSGFPDRGSISTHYYPSETSSSLLNGTTTATTEARSPLAWSLPARQSPLPSSSTFSNEVVKSTGTEGVKGAEDDYEDTENMEFRQPLYSDEDAPNAVNFSDLRSTIVNANTVEDNWFDFQPSTNTNKGSGSSKVLQYMNAFDNTAWKSSSLSLLPQTMPSSNSTSLIEEPLEWKESHVSSNASTVDNNILPPPPGLYNNTTTASLYSNPDISMLSFMSSSPSFATTTSAMTSLSKATVHTTTTSTTSESVGSYPSFSTIGSRSATNPNRFHSSFPQWKISSGKSVNIQKKVEKSEKDVDGEEEGSEADEEYAADRQAMLFLNTSDLLDSIITSTP
jgi:hypothetical protein